MGILQEKRLARGETQQQAADAVGVDRSTYAQIENERCRPSLTLAFKIADHFDSTPDELFRHVVYPDSQNTNQATPEVA